MDLVRLLNCLADGNYHSGVELGLALGVSRTAVWKELSKLSDVGIVLETLKGKGYRIPGGVDLLDRSFLMNHWESKGLSVSRFDLLQCVDSTNSYLMLDDKDIENGEYVVCMAEQQTAGRGRRGRVWHSPYAKNLYISIAFNLIGGVDALEGLSLALGGSVADCLDSQGVGDIGLKWPNDIWVNDKKLAGILVELKGESGDGWRVVVGLGVNVLMSDIEDGIIDQPWISLIGLTNETSLTRSLWGALLVDSLITGIEEYKSEGLAGALEGWRRYDMLKGRMVEALSGGLEGLCEGVDERGRLLVNAGEGVQTINAGEVSIRPNESSS